MSESRRAPRRRLCSWSWTYSSIAARAPDQPLGAAADNVASRVCQHADWEVPQHAFHDLDQPFLVQALAGAL